MAEHLYPEKRDIKRFTKNGRPSSLTPQVERRICEALAGGVDRGHACALAGISYTTFGRWIARGEADESGPYYNFRRAVDLAEGTLVEQCVGVLVDQMGSEDGRLAQGAAKFLLSHRFAEGYSQRRETTGAGGGPVQLQAAQGPPTISDQQLDGMSVGDLSELIASSADALADPGSE